MKRFIHFSVSALLAVCCSVQAWANDKFFIKNGSGCIKEYYEEYDCHAGSRVLSITIEAMQNDPGDQNLWFWLNNPTWNPSTPAFRMTFDYSSGSPNNYIGVYHFSVPELVYQDPCDPKALVMVNWDYTELARYLLDAEGGLQCTKAVRIWYDADPSVSPGIPNFYNPPAVNVGCCSPDAESIIPALSACVMWEGTADPNDPLHTLFKVRMENWAGLMDGTQTNQNGNYLYLYVYNQNTSAWMGFGSIPVSIQAFNPSSPSTDYLFTYDVTSFVSSSPSGCYSYFIDFVYGDRVLRPVPPGFVPQQACSCLQWGDRPAPGDEPEVFPNPTPGDFTVTIRSDRSQDAEIRLLDLSGKLLYNSRVKLSEGQNRQTLSLQSYTNGVYVVEVHYGNEVFRQRVIKN